MCYEVKEAWRSAIKLCLNELSKIPIKSYSPVLKWECHNPGSYTGKYTDEPDASMIFSTFNFNTRGMELEAIMLKHHPDHCALVGTPSLGKSNLGIGYYLERTCAELYARQKSMSVTDAAIEEIVEDIIFFIKSKDIEIEYIAPLVNFRCLEEIQSIILSPNIRIERLSDDEINAYFGGSPYHFNITSRREFGPLPYALRGVIVEQKVFGEQNDVAAGQEYCKRLLNKAMTILRVYKTGPIGYDKVYLRPSRYTPYLIGAGLYWADSYVPFGSYSIDGTDCKKIQELGKIIEKELHPSLASACSRLAASEIRTNPLEQLFDAVVGLEAILLTDISSDKYRGETRYRFAINLAAMQDTKKDRSKYFKIGKQLYDLRSRIAHGGNIDVKKEIKFGLKILPIGEIAKESCELLRRIVKSFIPFVDKPPYTRVGYWENEVFIKDTT